MSRGNGIVLVKNADVCEHVDRARRTGRAFVMQRYLDAPLLIAGRKWDLRLYVAITSIEPLQAYIYHEGFARFCSKVYDRQAEDIAGHLTNSYVSARQNRTTALPEGEAVCLCLCVCVCGCGSVGEIGHTPVTCDIVYVNITVSVQI